jgi:hypothetical protein
MTAAIASLLAVDATATLEDAQALDALDAFFSRASDVQARRSDDADDAFRTDARAVFQLYMRLLPALQQQASGADADTDAAPPQDSLIVQALHVTRVVPFCQVFGPRNADAVQQLLRALVDAAPAFRESLAALRDVYCQVRCGFHESIRQSCVYSC